MQEYSGNPQAVAQIQAYYSQYLQEGDNLQVQAFDATNADQMYEFLKSGDKAALVAHGGPEDPNVYDNKGGMVSFESLNKGMVSLVNQIKLFIDACFAKENLAVPEDGVNPYPNLEAADGAAGVHDVVPGAMKSLGVDVPEKK